MFTTYLKTGTRTERSRLSATLSWMKILMLDSLGNLKRKWKDYGKFSEPKDWQIWLMSKRFLVVLASTMPWVPLTKVSIVICRDISNVHERIERTSTWVFSRWFGSNSSLVGFVPMREPLLQVVHRNCVPVLIIGFCVMMSLFVICSGEKSIRIAWLAQVFELHFLNWIPWWNLFTFWQKKHAVPVNSCC